MKIKLLLFTLGLSFFTATAQFGPQQIISEEADLAFRAIPNDIDSDGFIDIVSASRGGDKIVWYKNQDGLGNFSVEQLITNNASAIEGMELFDLNGDDKIDIVYKTNLNKIAWLENLDGQGNFGPEQIIANTYYPYFMNAADLDGDGDLDVLALVHSSSVQNSIIWYKNLDGQGDFGTAIFIETTGDKSWELELFDLDNDGDQDIISSFNGGPGKLVWYENLDGLGNFDTYKEIYQFQYLSSWTAINSITSSDFNNDGNIDLLIDTILDETEEENIYWLENLGDQGTFSEPNNIGNSCTFSGSLRTYDIDNDGDLDILAAFYEFNHLENSTIAWYQNEDGLGNFGSLQIISSEVVRLKDATATDINGDGLLDVISASWYDNKIAWYENGVLGIEDQTESHFYLYPNPTNGELNINTNQEITLIEIYNTIGQKVLETRTEINLSNFESGIYFVKIKDSNGFSEVHKIIKE